jgi:hypothetical protein
MPVKTKPSGRAERHSDLTSEARPKAFQTRERTGSQKQPSASKRSSACFPTRATTPRQLVSPSCPILGSRARPEATAEFGDDVVPNGAAAVKNATLVAPVAIAHTTCMPTAGGRYLQICIEVSTAQRRTVGAANDRSPADHREGRETPSPASSWLIAAMPCSRAAIGSGEFAITSAASSTAANRT